jgi:hypothetical protein
MASSAYVDFGQVKWYLDSLHMRSNLILDRVHLQSQASARFPVVVSNFSAAPPRSDYSEPGTNRTSRVDIMELRKLPAEKPDVQYEF